jgi:hypothetical protein
MSRNQTALQAEVIGWSGLTSLMDRSTWNIGGGCTSFTCNNPSKAPER